MWVMILKDRIFEGKSIAVDIDGTLFIGDYKYPNLGYLNTTLIECLNKFRELGGIVVIWSLREKTSPLGDILTPALDCLKQGGLEWDYVNENIPCEVRKYNDDPRKVATTYYIDDRSIDMLSLIKLVYGSDV